MAKKSDTLPATQETGLVEPPPHISAVSVATQKRRPGRPPKAKSDSHQNGAVSATPSRKPSGRTKGIDAATTAAVGRPKRNRTPTAVASEAVASEAVAKSGRGRPKRSKTVPVTADAATVIGSRTRGRAKKDDDVAAATPAKKREEVSRRTTPRRPKKAAEATTQQEAAGELKRKTALLEKKVKQAADKLRIAVLAVEEVQALAAEM
ncbi:unnamed protein product [Cochlearia groenlandica]